MRRRAFTAWDAVLLLVLLAGNFALLPKTGAEGKALRAEILSDDGERALPLNRAAQVEVKGPLGVSRLEVGPRGVRFQASPCPNQTCVRTGWAGRPGQTLACVPNRVVVRVVAADAGRGGVDAVSR